MRADEKSVTACVRPLLVVILVSAVAGCGGSPVYGRDASAACMPKQAAISSVSTRRDDLDSIAQAASGGAISVKFGSGNFANVAFARTGRDAGRTYNAYKAAGAELAVEVSELIKRKNNVVVAFAHTPTADEWDAITGCLVKADDRKSTAPPTNSAVVRNTRVSRSDA